MNVVDKTGSTGFYIEGEASSEHMSFNYWVCGYLFLVLVQHDTLFGRGKACQST